jgi:lipopolysaccharide assembly protein A
MRVVVAVPFLLLLVLFALSNTAPVAIGLWPTDLALHLPLSLAVLGGMALAFLAGALLVWAEALRQRRRARRAEASVRLLEARLAETRPRALLPE